MAVIYKNVTTAGAPATTDLIAKGNKEVGRINKITISNNDGDQADNVALFLEDETAAATTNAGNIKYYFFKDVNIPQGASLVLDDNLAYDGSLYHLRITTTTAGDGGTPDLTLIIK